MHRLREVRRLPQLQGVWVPEDLLVHRVQGDGAGELQAVHALQGDGGVPPDAGEVPCLLRGVLLQAGREGLPHRNPRWDQRKQRAAVPRAGELRPDDEGLRGPCGEDPGGPPPRLQEGRGGPFDGCQAVPQRRTLRVLVKHRPFEWEVVLG